MQLDTLLDLGLAVGKGFITQAVGYFAFVGVVFLLVWRVGASRLAAARIDGRRLEARQLRREIANTVAVLATGALTAGGLFWLHARGYTALSADARAFSWPGLVASFCGVIVLNDAWFYGWHRVLHHPRVFKHVHVVHHRSVLVNPFTSYSFHVLESFVLGAWVIPYVLFVPTYLPMIAVLQAVGLANNVNAHLGFELYPRWFVRVPPFRWLTSATYHALHHGGARANYGLFFRFWDRAFGTEDPDYERRFVERGDGRTIAR